MREDMFKVIVERPRRRSTKRVLPSVIRLRDDLDGPARLGMRMGYDYRELNENLGPLRRYLEAAARMAGAQSPWPFVVSG